MSYICITFVIHLYYSVTMEKCRQQTLAQCITSVIHLYYICRHFVKCNYVVNTYKICSSKISLHNLHFAIISNDIYF